MGPSRSARAWDGAGGALIRRGLPLGLWLLASAGGGPVDGSVDSIMKELAHGFRELEGALNAVDLGAARAAAEELARRSADLPEAPPELARDSEPRYRELTGRLGHIARDLAERAASNDLEATAAAFVALRATCVACHVRFRSDNEKRGSFPARANGVTGEVRLFDVDGRAQEDRSWVLVFLEGGPPAPAPLSYEVPLISQKERRFDPRVLPVQVGSEVRFPNDDSIFHNVFSLSRTAPFDLGVYEPGQSASVRLEKSGLIKVYCNIHPEMSASIVVLENPWFALCDADGRFVISDVPDGEYRLRGWNERGAESSQELSVSGNRLLVTRLELHESRRSLPHTNKYGKPYSGKYK